MRIGILLLFSAVALCCVYGRSVWWNKHAADSESEELQYAWPPRQRKGEKNEPEPSNIGSGNIPADFGQRMPWQQLEAHLAGSRFLGKDESSFMPTSDDLDTLFKPQPDEGWQWEDPDFQDWIKPSSPKKKKDVSSLKKEKKTPKQRQHFFWLAEQTPRPRNGISKHRRLWVMESRSWDNPADQVRNNTTIAQDNKTSQKKNKAKPKERRAKAPLRSLAGNEKHAADSSSLSNERHGTTTAQEQTEA
uniref:Uncharacterized protein n=1 Tax=Trichuris muris TaxID=70415 RepID=A0A5S6QZW4_TRIMR